MDIGILLILLVMIIYLVDPGKQLNKAKDGQRREDFKQIRAALDTYYNDTNCYPTTIPFGQPWEGGGQSVYMKQVPQDPSCVNGSSCYTYTVPQAEQCPQWHVLFGKLSQAPTPNAPGCLLQDTCLPFDYSTSGYNFCDFGGDIDCSSLQAVSLAQSTPVVTSTPGPPNDTPIPTPSAAPTIPSNGIFYCACGANHVTVCNISYNVPENAPYYLDPSCSGQCGIAC